MGNFKIVLFSTLAIFLLSLGLASASNVSIEYRIIEESVIVDYNFIGHSENLELRVPYDATALELNIPKTNYALEDMKEYKMIKIASAENLSLKYITKSLIDKSGGNYYFISKNYLNEKSNIELILPESAILIEDGILFPSPDIITSDGRSIILSWKDYNDEQILINYKFVKQSNWTYYLIFFILILALIAYSIFQRKKLRREIEIVKEKSKKRKTKEQKKEDLTRNLYEDEKRIVIYLLNKKDNESWTKEMINDLGISKVKLSRKLRSLEAKEIIKKIPYGNENRIRLMRKK